LASNLKNWNPSTWRFEALRRRLASPLRGRLARRADGGDGGEAGTRLPLWKRLLLHASAVAAALVCAALLVNYVVMPIIVRRGDLVAAPQFVGMSLLEAERLADRSGLRIRVDTDRPDPVLPAGAVVSQTPGGGAEMKRGRSVAVVLSSGVDMRRVPALAGLHARQAQLDAEHAGFAIQKVVEAHTSYIERGRVVGTDPGEGAARPAGTGLSLLVSLGPRPAEFAMPSLVGRTTEEARLIVEQLGLVMRSVKYDRGRSRVARELVVVQDPVAGSHVVEGEGVTLRIGS
jgi:beta-lactam-binding protein with PASTA domain